MSHTFDIDKFVQLGIHILVIMFLFNASYIKL